jgi:hypothetical protein
MAGQTKVTTDHKTIRKWIEEHGGKPASVKSTSGDDDPGLLRVDFPGYSGSDSLEEIPWEDFFDKFDEKDLAFMYQEEMTSGKESRFFKFVSRKTADQVDENKRK